MTKKESRYPLVEMRLSIATSLVKEALEKVPGVPWKIVAHNATAIYNENKDRIQKSEYEFFIEKELSDTFISPGWIYEHRSDIYECMEVDHNACIVFVKDGRIRGIKLSNDKEEIKDRLEFIRSTFEGSLENYNEGAERAKDRFGLDDIELLTTIAQLPSETS